MLFRKENNTKTLTTLDNAEIKKYVNVSIGLTFDRLNPFLRAAEYKYIVRLLGDKLYKQLTDYYYTLDPNYDVTKTDFATYNQSDFSNHDYTADKILIGEDPNKKNVLPLYDLLQFCQAALINLAILEGFDQLKTVLSDTGLSTTDVANRLFKYEEDNLRRSFSDAGLNWIERTIGFLIRNIKEPALKDFDLSPCYADFKDSIVQTTEQFDKVFNIRGSRLVFLNMRQFMNDVVDMQISQVFTPELLEDLKANRSLEEKDPNKTKLLGLIANAVIQFSVVRAVSEYGLQFGDPGAFFTTIETDKANNERKTHIEADRVSEIQKNHTTIAAGWLSMAISYAKANNITGASAETNQTISRTTNSHKRTFWT